MRLPIDVLATMSVPAHPPQTPEERARRAELWRWRGLLRQGAAQPFPAFRGMHALDALGTGRVQSLGLIQPRDHNQRHTNSLKHSIEQLDAFAHFSQHRSVVRHSTPSHVESHCYVIRTADTPRARSASWCGRASFACVASLLVRLRLLCSLLIHLRAAYLHPQQMHKDKKNGDDDQKGGLGHWAEGTPSSQSGSIAMFIQPVSIHATKKASAMASPNST